MKKSMTIAEMLNALDDMAAVLQISDGTCPTKRETGVSFCSGSSRKPEDHCPKCRALYHVDQAHRALEEAGPPVVLTTKASRSLAQEIEDATRRTYRSVLTKHNGSIGEAARDLDVSHDTVSRNLDRLGLRAWLDKTYPHRDPATKGRKGDVRKNVRKGQRP